jgi:hypothetical protein
VVADQGDWAELIDECVTLPRFGSTVCMALHTVGPSTVGAEQDQSGFEGSWKSLGNQTPNTARTGGYGMDAAHRLSSINATALNGLDRLGLIPKPCAQVRILPGAPPSWVETAARHRGSKSAVRYLDRIGVSRLRHSVGCARVMRPPASVACDTGALTALSSYNDLGCTWASAPVTCPQVSEGLAHPEISRFTTLWFQPLMKSPWAVSVLPC